MAGAVSTGSRGGRALRSVAGGLSRRLTGRRAPRFRYVVVVTYGRSGSTLVQGLLNTLPRTVVRGENGLYLLELHRARAVAQALRRRHLRHAPRQVHSAFYGLHLLRPASFVVSARRLVTGHLLGPLRPGRVDVLGFKEVQWHRVGADETADFFDYLDLVLPGCRYVLNRRDPEQAAGSGFWQGRDGAEVRASIDRVLEIQEHLRQTRPDRTLDLEYERVTSEDRAVSDEQLRRLATFVRGECDEDLLARMRQTLATGHGPFPFGRSRDRKARRGRRQPSTGPQRGPGS